MEFIKYNQLFDGIDSIVELEDGRRRREINFDNGATTPPLKCVNQAVHKHMLNYGPISRGTGAKGDYCTMMYEQSKEVVLDFFGVANNPTYQVVYVKNATEGINLLANLLEEQVGMTLTTRMEHHSNDLPWRKHGRVIYIEPDRHGRIYPEYVAYAFEQYGNQIKCLAVTGASNVTGYVNAIYEMAKIVHKYDAIIVVDGAQLVAHRAIDLNGNSPDEAIDFIVFSGHKIYAPYGAGAVVGRFDCFSKDTMFMLGGGTVDQVRDKKMTIAECPACYEAGTQNYLGAVALSTALTELKRIGYQNIVKHEDELRYYLVSQLKKIEDVILYGDSEGMRDRIGVVPFNIRYKSCEEVAEKLAYKYGIATRFGKFCAHPYVERIMMYKGLPIDETPDYYGEYGLVRVSLGLYNTIEEIDYFIACIKEICTHE